MFSLIHSEILKMRHTFSIRLVVLAPVVTVLLGYLLSGSSVQFAAYNWWYTIILPTTIAVWSSNVITCESHTHYQNILCLSVKLSKVWVNKFIAVAILVLTSNLIMWGCCTVLGLFTETKVSVMNGFIGCLFLFLTFIWQIPITMIIAKCTGYLSAILISFGCNVLLSFVGAENELFFLNLYAIPSRIVCPFFKIQPNGITLALGSLLLETATIPLALAISLISATLALLITTQFFSKGVKHYD